MKARTTVVLIAGLALGGCTHSVVNLSPDFGQAVRQDVKAQIADPDARYEGVPAPGAVGSHVQLGQQRYEKGQVIQPSSTTASGQTMDNGSGAGAGSGANGASAGTGQ